MAKKPTTTRGPMKFVAARLYGQGSTTNNVSIIGGGATLDAAKAAAAKDMQNYRGEYGYGIYGLVGTVKPVVPEVKFETSKDCPCTSLAE